MNRRESAHPFRIVRPSRRRRALLLAQLAMGGAAAVVGAADSGTAHAQDIELSDAERKSFRTSQSFAISVHFGPYRPDIDGEFRDIELKPNQARPTPYKTFYGGRKLLSQVGFEWQFLRRFGTLALGANAGYFRASGKNPTVENAGDLSVDETKLTIVPLGASLIYRFDVTNERYGIPVIPYAKVGLDYAIWWALDSNGGLVSDRAGGKARGGTAGWHGTLGLSLVLDFLDPDAAHQFDADTGVNHTHLFFEFTQASINGLGQAHKLRMGDTTWNMGLLFEF